MSFESFNTGLDLIKDHPAFAVSPKGCKQATVKHQLLVFLRIVETERNGAFTPNLRNVCGIGEGTAELNCQRVVKDLLSLQEGHHMALHQRPYQARLQQGSMPFHVF